MRVFGKTIKIQTFSLFSFSINEKLDLDLIKQQTETSALDFGAYASYVLTLMGQLCAPVRDEEIAKLKQTTDVVPLFKVSS